MFLEDRTFYFRNWKQTNSGFVLYFRLLRLNALPLYHVMPDIRIIYPNETIFFNLVQYLSKSSKVNLPIFRINFTFYYSLSLIILYYLIPLFNTYKMTKASLLNFQTRFIVENYYYIKLLHQNRSQTSKKCVPKYELSLNNQLPNKVTIDVNPIYVNSWVNLVNLKEKDTHWKMW